MIEDYDERAKKKRQAWELYKALKKDDCYKHADLYEKAFLKARKILVEFSKEYTFKYSEITDREIEDCINFLVDLECKKEKTIELTDKIISEFIENI